MRETELSKRARTDEHLSLVRGMCHCCKAWRPLFPFHEKSICFRCLPKNDQVRIIRKDMRKQKQILNWMRKKIR